MPNINLYLFVCLFLSLSFSLSCKYFFVVLLLPLSCVICICFRFVFLGGLFCLSFVWLFLLFVHFELQFVFFFNFFSSFSSYFYFSKNYSYNFLYLFGIFCFSISNIRHKGAKYFKFFVHFFFIKDSLKQFEFRSCLKRFILNNLTDVFFFCN